MNEVDLERCTVCNRDFPDHLINPLFSSVSGNTQCCPICALQISNRDHGVERTSFTGTTAQKWLEQAQAWIKASPATEGTR